LTPCKWLKGARPVLATGAGQLPGGTGTRQDLHFEGRAFIATRLMGENSAIRITIEFDQNFVSCTRKVIRGSNDGKPVRRTDWGGNIQRLISIQVTDNRCTIQDGNAFQQ
jgi:hypothetical protein